MIVHRVLDAFFRTLDAVDAVRERMDRALGREPKPDPWAVEWPPIDDAPPAVGTREAAPEARPQSRPPSSAKSKRDATPRVDDAGVVDLDAPTKAAAPKAARAKASAGTKKATTKSTAGRKKSTTSNRKGSVDKVGADLDSPRARAIHTRVLEAGLPIVDETSEAFGKRVLARTLWALVTAERAGSEKGLTTNDMAALLHLTAGIEVFATNIGRACRDHGDLITDSDPDGRTRRFILTDAGRAAAQTLTLR